MSRFCWWNLHFNETKRNWKQRIERIDWTEAGVPRNSFSFFYSIFFFFIIPFWKKNCRSVSNEYNDSNSCVRDKFVLLIEQNDHIICCCACVWERGCRINCLRYFFSSLLRLIRIFFLPETALMERKHLIAIGTRVICACVGNSIYFVRFTWKTTTQQ